MKTEVICNQTWNNFLWPDWVPEKIRNEVEGFHLESWGRGPASWIECSVRSKAPKFGMRVRIIDWHNNPVVGKYIHAWNNVGRVLGDDGIIHCVGCSSFEVSKHGLFVKPEPQDYANDSDPLPFYGRN